MSIAARPAGAVLVSRLGWRDLVRAGAAGLLTRRLRAALSVLGVAIGIAALVAVLGISNSSRADLLGQLDALGTNLLTVEPGQSFTGGDVTLPDTSAAMVARIAPVTDVGEVADVSATARRSELIPRDETGGISVRAASTDLLSIMGGSMNTGKFLDRASERLPAVVLGSVAAERLGISSPGVEVVVGGRRMEVIGIMDSLPLAQDLDRAVLMGIPEATRDYGAGVAPSASKLYVRSEPESVNGVRDVLARTVNPGNPTQVDVSRPSDALVARAAADSALTAIFLGLGLVALVVGGIGIANVMVISVLERRSEIGLRRALGARRTHISKQFLAEALILSGIGGVVGAVLGILATGAYALASGSGFAMPWWAPLAGILAALVIGAAAGLYPAKRAAALPPTDALRSV